MSETPLDEAFKIMVALVDSLGQAPYQKIEADGLKCELYSPKTGVLKLKITGTIGDDLPEVFAKATEITPERAKVHHTSPMRLFVGAVKAIAEVVEVVIDGKIEIEMSANPGKWPLPPQYV